MANAVRNLKNGSPAPWNSKNAGRVNSPIFELDMWTFAILCLVLPASALVICFLTGFIYRFDEVNETMCGVRNYIPSISAVTGIRPQTYLWRTCIGLQSAPRFAVCFFYYNQYRNKMHQVAPSRLAWYKKLLGLNFWLNFTENACLVLVAFITNKENYPVHEKIFIVFMITSLCYMLLNTILFKWSREGYSSNDELRSYYWKKVMFVVNILSTAGLIFFFIQHRLYCIHGAFSMFSFCEYIIAFSNMAYHFTGYLDFKGLTVVCGNYEKAIRLLAAHGLPQTAPVRFKSRGFITRTRKPVKKWFDPKDQSWAEPIYKRHEQKHVESEQAPSMLHMVYRIKSHYTRPYWEKDILKEYGLFDKMYNPVVMKNTPDVNSKLKQIQHLVRIKPVTFPYGLPKDETDYKHCFLNENGEFIVKQRIQDGSSDSEQAWREVKMVEERPPEDAIWKMDKDTIQKESQKILRNYKLSEEYFREKYVYKYNQDGNEYRYKGENKINSERQDWH